MLKLPRRHQVLLLCGLMVASGSMTSIAQAESSQVMEEALRLNPSPTFIKIRAGTFQMGSPLLEPWHDPNEYQHKVTLTKDYEIAATELTQLQWAVVMRTNPSGAKKFHCPTSFNTQYGVCPDLPVANVSWDEVQTFLKQLNSVAKDGYTYRLPTEAEWEFAARAGTTTAYSFGDDGARFKDHGFGYFNRYTDEAQEEYVKQLKVKGLLGPDLLTAPVALKLPNPWGLYDIHGNVSEWVQDSYDARLLEDAIDPLVLDGDGRVHRGGNYDVWEERGAYRSAVRARSYWTQTSPAIGLRLVRTLKGQ